MASAGFEFSRYVCEGVCLLWCGGCLFGVSLGRVCATVSIPLHHAGVTSAPVCHSRGLPLLGICPCAQNV